MVEMLVVLSVFMLLISISITVIPEYKAKRELESFLNQFSKDFHFAQMYAINHQATVVFRVDFASGRYFVMKGIDEELLSKKIPGNINYLKGSLDSRIYFTPVGTVSSFGAWLFESKRVRYTFTILIGSGRHYYREI